MSSLNIASTADASEITVESFQKVLADIRPEFRVPGFWDALNSNVLQWASDISVGNYWAEVKKRLPQWRAEYRSFANSDLLATFELPLFVAKPSDSLINKLLRYHKNGNLQGHIPLEGAPIPIVSDIVRTRIKCQYIDGVEFLASKLHALGVELDISSERERQGKIEGYFAQHVNIRQEVIYREAGHGQIAKISCEMEGVRNFV
jgi:ppGpp synthetase/RelA/SpoT-type nucleotidyltranferase